MPCLPCPNEKMVLCTSWTVTPQVWRKFSFVKALRQKYSFLPTARSSTLGGPYRFPYPRGDEACQKLLRIRRTTVAAAGAVWGLGGYGDARHRAVLRGAWSADLRSADDRWFSLALRRTQ